MDSHFDSRKLKKRKSRLSRAVMYWTGSHWDSDIPATAQLSGKTYRNKVCKIA